MGLGIAIVGSGGMGLTWAEVVARRTPDANLVAVWGGTRAAELARAYGCSAAPSLDALLGRPDVDAVIIASPLVTHCDYVIRAAAAGRHVFLEKPMSVTMAEADAMIEAAETADVRLAVVTQHRFRVAPVAAKRLIAEGAIGDVRMVQARAMLSWPDPPPGHVPWAELGYHVCDLLRWLVGSEPSGVSARFLDSPGSHVGGPGHDATSRSIMALVTFESGAAASIWLSYEVPPPGLGSQIQYLLVGSRGILDLDSYDATRLGTADGWQVIARQPQGDPADPLDPVRIDTYVPQFHDFVQAVAEHRAPVVDGHEARRTMRLVLAALAAHDVPGVSPGGPLTGRLVPEPS
jgi:myo-inositol 2-dehydrogenase/D-chiro-inositol 1-dehydrogenase